MTLRERRAREALTQTNAELALLASTDGLTGLANRRVFDERMAMEYAVAETRMLPLSLLLVDVDDFKRRNDRFGHAEGDEVLRHLGGILMGICQPGELAARVGGEDFALLLPGAGAREAQRRAQTLQRALEERQLRSGPITVSIGVSARNFTTRTWRHLVGRADEAMYSAKRAGKNRIVLHQQLSAARIPAEPMEEREMYRVCA